VKNCLHLERDPLNVLEVRFREEQTLAEYNQQDATFLNLFL